MANTLHSSLVLAVRAAAGLLTLSSLAAVGTSGDASPGACWAENQSYSTTCAEEDNVNVPIFAPGAKRFLVVATHPKYNVGDQCRQNPQSCCAKDFSGCNAGAVAAAQTEDICTELWAENGIDVFNVCTVADWWRPYTMTVTAENQAASAHYLQWHRKIPDKESWPQVLVLYEDGNMRLKPHPPPNAQDVCFGSSVIIGPAPVDNVPPIRPHIDIEQVVISPTASSLAITYRSGEQASLNLSVDRADATAEVDVGYATTDIPLSTFRSMWVADGNSDVDHVEANQGDFPILGSWTSLEGPSWFFYRQFRSTHNTSAPDISIELDTDADAFTDRIELLMGTNPLLACPATTNANDENPDAWPPDGDDDRDVDTGDLIRLFGDPDGDGVPIILVPANYTPRSDFDADGDVDVGDLIAGFRGTIGTNCAA